MILSGIYGFQEMSQAAELLLSPQCCTFSSEIASSVQLTKAAISHQPLGLLLDVAGQAPRAG